MSIDSYATIWCKFPKGTKVTDNRLFETLDAGDRLLINEQFDRVYSDHLLDDLVAFFDKPLDEVPGIELHVTYETWEEDFFKMEFDIVNGRKYYKESRIVMAETPVSECPFDYGQSIKIERAKRAWHELDDVCIDDDECIDEDFHSNVLDYTYEKGTSRYDIWHDIEDFLGVSVAYLIGESKKPFFAE